MKRQRQEAMLEIIQNRCIETQEELLEALKEKGFPGTQATISRDMKELPIEKRLENGVYCYYRMEKETTTDNSLVYLMKNSVISVVAAENIVVVKTLPGHAMATCTSFDKMEIKGSVGTLAGDDTFILIMADRECACSFATEMTSILL